MRIINICEYNFTELHVFFSLIFTINLWGRYYYYFFLQKRKLKNRKGFFLMESIITVTIISGHCCLSFFPWLWQWLHGYMHMSKLITLYTLTMCSFSYTNYTSIKDFCFIAWCPSMFIANSSLCVLYPSSSVIFEGMVPLLFSPSHL